MYNRKKQSISLFLKMQTLLKKKLSVVIFIILIVDFPSSTATSFDNDNNLQHGWRLIKSKIGEWKLVAPPGLNSRKLGTSYRRNLRDGPLFNWQPSPLANALVHGDGRFNMVGDGGETGDYP